MSTSFSRGVGIFLSVVCGAIFHLPAAVGADAPPNPAPAAVNPTPPPAPPERVGRTRGAAPAVQGQRANFPGGLNLDDQQRSLLREANQKEGDELRQLHEKLQVAQKELIDAIIGEKYDETVVRAKAEAAGRIQTDITVLRARAFATVSPTLTPEQRQQLENPQMAHALILGGGAIGGVRNFPGPGGQVGPGGPRPGPDGQPPGDRNFRRRDGGTAPDGAPQQPRRRGGPEQ
jgi:Spy/CpxP family protein refolding chaperone